MSYGKTRPNPLQWIGYAFGRTLPVGMRDWVARDLTGRNRFARHLIRGMVPFVPISALFVILLPGSLWLRFATVLLGVLLALFYSAAYMNQNREKRLRQHGLPADLADPELEARRAAERDAYLARHRRA
ncbi:MAG: DUF5313 family protein [Aldersonia sp.]|nr:DUF5313 family protein [Aldersonia sp.]